MAGYFADSPRTNGICCAAPWYTGTGRGADASITSGKNEECIQNNLLGKLKERQFVEEQILELNVSLTVHHELTILKIPT